MSACPPERPGLVKIQIVSDLHLEFLESLFPGARFITPAPDADVLILAGDIHNGAHAVRVFGDWPVPVIYVPGNHEFYGHDFEQLRAELRIASAGTTVTVLDDESVTLGGVRFLGSTMWTDYRLMPEVPLKHAMALADRTLADYGYITVANGNPFSAQSALAQHRQSRLWLKEQLALSVDRPTVVVTHHGCSVRSTAKRFAGSPVNGAFMSNLAPLMGPNVNLWVHGHVHDTFDYEIKGTRVVANPRGYALNRREAKSHAELQWENLAFISQLVVEV